MKINKYGTYLFDIWRRSWPARIDATQRVVGQAGTLRRLRHTFISMLLFFGSAHLAAAASWDQFLTIDLGKTGLPNTDPVTITFNIMKAVLQLFGVLALALVLYGGFTLLTSVGNPEKIQKGRGIIVWAAIGILVILSSIGILNFVSGVI